MKLLIVGCGQCGGRIADEFARLNRVAHAQRGLSIVANAIAVNTDIADLSGLRRIKPDYQHRILIGDRKTGGARDRVSAKRQLDDSAQRPALQAE